MTDRRVAGGILVLLGAVALIEARRLAELREEMVAGAVVGDDTLPLVLGGLLVVHGVWTLFFARLPHVAVTFPQGSERRQLVAAVGMLLAYVTVVPYAGYTVSTFLAAVGLFGGMGGYRWTVSLALAAAVTVSLHLLFRVWLLQPLPTGWLGI